MTQLMARTWRFDLTFRMDALSDSDEVCTFFKASLDAAQARLALPGLIQSSFFYDVPDEGLAQISGYVHLNRKCRETAVRPWLFDNRIKSDEIEWRPIHPGTTGDWKQQPLIKTLFATRTGRSCRPELAESADCPEDLLIRAIQNSDHKDRVKPIHTRTRD